MQFNYQGLFGCVSGGTIKNLTVTGNVTGSDYVGGIVGSLNNSAKVINCRSDVNATTSNSRGSVGSAVGKLNSIGDVVENCVAYGTVTANNSSFAGGTVGETSNGGKVRYCYYKGSLQVVGHTAAYNSNTKGYATYAYTFTDSVGQLTQSNTGASTETLTSYGNILSNALQKWVNANSGYTSWETDINGYPGLTNTKWTKVGNYDTSWYFADTSATSYTITTAAQLAGLAVLVNGDDGTNTGYYKTVSDSTTPTGELITAAVNFKNKTIYLGGDIDISTYYWTPIGTRAYDSTFDGNRKFLGTFDGQGKVISGMIINNTSVVVTDKANVYAGLFGFADNGSIICNTDVIGTITVDVTGNHSALVGGIVGSANTTLFNCFTRVNMTVASSAPNDAAYQVAVGGITGNAGNNAKIYNCYTEGNVTESVSGAEGGGVIGIGGIIGMTVNTVVTDENGVVENTPEIRNCYGRNTVSFTLPNNNNYKQAGSGDILGLNAKTINAYTGDVKISNCYETPTNEKIIYGDASIFTITKNGVTSNSVTGCGTFTNVSGTLTAGTDENFPYAQTLQYGSNLLNALNAYASEKTTATIPLWGWKIETTAGDPSYGYPVLDKPITNSGNWADTGYYDTSWYLDDTTQTSYTLSNAAQLAGLAVLVNGDDNKNEGYYKTSTGTTITTGSLLTTSYNFSGITINLGADISLNDELTRQWTPIGTSTKSFLGTFNGAGHTVGNIFIANSSGSEQGLFGTVGGTVQNLAVSGSVSGGTDVGSIAGTVASGGIVQNCYNTGSVNGVTNAGGIAGSVASGGTVRNCYNIGSISGTTSVGGIAGSNAGTVSCCYYINTNSQAVGSGTAETASTSFSNNSTALTTTFLSSATLLEALNAWVISNKTANPLVLSWTTDTTQNSGYPIFTSTSVTLNISATVPLYVTLAVTNTGALVGPTNYTIANTGNFSIKVASAVIQMYGSYQLTSINPPANSDYLYVTLKEDTKTEVSVHSWNTATTPDWSSIAPNTSLKLIFGGQVKAITDDLTTSQKVFTITYTVAPSLG